MKNKILYTLMVVSISAMLFGCASNSGESKDNNKPVETPQETKETVTNGTDDVTEATEEDASEAESKEDGNGRKLYAFEGKYWVDDDEYKAVGYYFDGLDLTMIVEGESKTVRPYEADSNSINFIDGDAFDEYYWEIQNDLLILQSEDFEETSLYQVGESTFEDIFNWVSDTYEPPIK